MQLKEKIVNMIGLSGAEAIQIPSNFMRELNFVTIVNITDNSVCLYPPTVSNPQAGAGIVCLGAYSTMTIPVNEQMRTGFNVVWTNPSGSNLDKVKIVRLQFSDVNLGQNASFASSFMAGGQVINTKVVAVDPAADLASGTKQDAAKGVLDTIAASQATAAKQDTLAGLVATAAKQDTLAGLVATAAKQDAAKGVLDAIAASQATAAKQDTLAGLVATAAKQDAAKGVLDTIATALNASSHAWPEQATTNDYARLGDVWTKFTTKSGIIRIKNTDAANAVLVKVLASADGVTYDIELLAETNLAAGAQNNLVISDYYPYVDIQIKSAVTDAPGMVLADGAAVVA